MKTLNEKIEVMHAFRNGFKVQQRIIPGMAVADEIKWEDSLQPDWNWERYDYRVKRDARIFYSIELSGGRLSEPQLSIDRISSSESSCFKIIKLVEVCDD